jgi:MFS family permease
MRVIQGFALGGEYGGAAIYVAEHASDRKRGFLTSWINVTAGIGLVLALSVIFITRTVMGEETFAEWGWRIPFLLSAGLLAVSLLIRMRLEESPAFVRMKSEQGVSKAPFSEAFGRWRNLKLVLLALCAIMLAQGAVWYAGHFYAQFFLERVLKVPGPTVNALLIAAVAISAPLYVFFGWLSDRVGRKPIMLFGMILFIVAAFPGFRYMSVAANPALVEASERAPVVVTAAASDRSTQFDPLGRNKPVLGGDVLTRALADAGVPYRSGPGIAGRPAVAVVGERAVQAPSLVGLPAETAEAARKRVAAEIRTALTAAGYPQAADPARINKAGVLAVLLVFMVAATALYGPQAAALVEIFPTRVRYTALSLPYHVGTGWVGGFLPFTAFAMVAATGDPYFGLWYPVIFTAISVLVSLFLLPETRGRALD